MPLLFVAVLVDFCYTVRQKGCDDMRSDCHMHMILDGYEWKAAIARHAEPTLPV